uniref:Dynein axonemal intermediate chain 3 n=1 Tax=Oreochromis niloticus TaxID=8128 RepID=I3JQM8_ORENI
MKPKSSFYQITSLFFFPQLFLNAPEDHPDDIYPIVLTTATQELFECCIDEDVTDQSPYKLLKKDDIIQDIKTRAAVSDFHPVKQFVLDYPEDEILLVFDVDFTYGQSFYLVLTPEAKARIYNPPQPEIIEVLEDDVSKTPEPKPWISLGSELEVDQESVKETREKLCYKFYLKRRPGLPVCFSDRNSTEAECRSVECPSYQDSRFSIKRMQRDCGMQAVPRLQSSTTQTQRAFQRNIFTQYEPRELSKKEKERILSSENLRKFLNSVTPRVLHALQQTHIMNVFTDDFKALGIGAEASDRLVMVSEGLKLQWTFTDEKRAMGNKISSVSWHPTIHGLIAVAFIKKQEEQLDKSTAYINSPAFIVFYGFPDQSNPRLLLECPDDIFAFEFCPSNPNVIVGGCRNGKVVLWDISFHAPHLQGTQPNSKKENKTPVMRYCAVSSIESRNDCQIKLCIFSICLTSLPGAKPLLCFRTHAWFVNTMQRSPFFKDILLTTGGWNFAIWKEGVMGGPIFVGPSSEQEYSAACWSLSRPAVFFIGRNDGSIEVWNLLLNTSESTHFHEHIASTRITCIKPCIASSKQHYLAVADNLGMLRVFSVPKTLRSPVKNEDLNMQIFFDREHDRLKDYLEWEEQWAKQRKEAGESKKQVVSSGF